MENMNHWKLSYLESGAIVQTDLESLSSGGVLRLIVLDAGISAFTFQCSEVIVILWKS